MTGAFFSSVTSSPSTITAHDDEPMSPPVVISVVADASNDSFAAMLSVRAAIGPVRPCWANVSAWVWCIANTIPAELHAEPSARAIWASSEMR